MQNTNVKIKVEWPADTTINDTAPDGGDGFLQIKAGVTLNAPTTATILRVGQNTNVTWSHPGGLGNVRLKYTTNWSGCSAEATPGDLSDTSCWITMTTPTSATALSAGGSGSTYVWQPPNIVGTNVGIRILEEANPNLVYDQKGPYTVKGKITVTSPVSSSIMRVGNQYTITWSAAGTIGNVYIDLDYNGDGSSDYAVLPAPPPSPGGLYTNEGGPCAALTVDASAQQFVWGSVNHFTNSSCTTARGTIPTPNPMPCTNCVLKVYKTDEPNETTGVADSSDTFKIQGKIDNVRFVETPPFGIGDTVEIRWDPTPSGANWGTVKLKYTVNGGDNWTDVDATATNNVAEPPETYSNYSWTIPNNANLPSSTTVVRVQLVGDESNTYDDSAQFSVTGSVLLTGDSLNGSATPWKIGEQKSITWGRNGSGIGNVRISYSLDGGVDNFPYNIATVPSANEAYTWCVGYGADPGQNYSDCGTPTDPGATDAHDPDWVIGGDRNAQIRLKIVALDAQGGVDSSVTGNQSTGNLIIQKQFLNAAVPSPTLEVSDPADSATFKNITWITKGKLPGNVLLRYDTGALTYPNNVNPGGAAMSDYSGYLWQVPDAIGYNTIRGRVKADVPNDTYVYGDSAAFTIKGKILTSAPTGASTLIVGVPYSIQYKKLGTLGNLEIIYDHSGNTTVITPPSVPGPEGTDQSTTFNWTPIVTDSGGQNVIDVGGTKNSKFKLTGLTHKGNANLEATAETPPFQVRGSIYNGSTDRLIAEPAGGETYAIGDATPRFIRWRARGNVGNVRVRLDTNEGKGVNETDSTDDFASLVRRPDSACGGSPPCYAESVAYNLQEDAGDPTNYTLEWLIPDSATTKGRILVESLDNPYVRTDPNDVMSTYGISGANFRIRIGITVTSPNAPPTPHFKVNDPMSIDWNQTGTGNVKIVLYYDNDGAPYANSYTIAPSTDVKPFPWTITSAYVAESAIITVSSAIDSTVADSTDTPFKIKPVLDLLTPDDNSAIVVVGGSYLITWGAPVGSAPSLKINFSTNGGKGADGNINTTADNWPDTNCALNLAQCAADKGGIVATSVDAAAGEYNWTPIPDLMTNEAVVRISKVGDSETYDDSDQYFYIKGSIANVYIKNNVNDSPPGTPIDLPINNDKYVTWDYS